RVMEWKSRALCRMCWRAWARRASPATTGARAADRAAAPAKKKTCAARGGKRVAAHKSSEHRGSCSQFHGAVSQKSAPAGETKQAACQAVIHMIIMELHESN